MSKKQHISTEMKANIADALAGGLSYAMIADRYDVSYSTIQRVKSAVINGANFIAKKEVPEVHDTPTEQKKSPETVSTPIEPVTEDITDSGNPADTNIIPDVPEVVKGVEPIIDDVPEPVKKPVQIPEDPPYSPYNSEVYEAVLERRDKIINKIAELKQQIFYYESQLHPLENYRFHYLEEVHNAT